MWKSDLRESDERMRKSGCCLCYVHYLPCYLSLLCSLPSLLSIPAMFIAISLLSIPAMFIAFPAIYPCYVHYLPCYLSLLCSLPSLLSIPAMCIAISLLSIPAMFIAFPAIHPCYVHCLPCYLSLLCSLLYPCYLSLLFALRQRPMWKSGLLPMDDEYSRPCAFKISESKLLSRSIYGPMPRPSSTFLSLSCAPALINLTLSLLAPQGPAQEGLAPRGPGLILEHRVPILERMWPVGMERLSRWPVA
jgi:hypothetical protein